jgi:hypothetical protein
MLNSEAKYRSLKTALIISIVYVIAFILSENVYAQKPPLSMPSKDAAPSTQPGAVLDDPLGRSTPQGTFPIPDNIRGQGYWTQ